MKWLEVRTTTTVHMYEGELAEFVYEKITHALQLGYNCTGAFKCENGRSRVYITHNIVYCEWMNKE